MSRTIVVELTDEQRKALGPILDAQADGDFEGGILAQITNTGQRMEVTYLNPEEYSSLRRLLDALKKAPQP